MGVVPVATRLAGATDFVIEHAKDGLLCDAPDPDAFAAAISRLHADREELARLSSQAAESVRKRFAIPIVAGLYRRNVMLASGRYAMLDDGMGFSLVPWKPVIEQRLGQQIAATVRGGVVSWSFGRTRSLSV